MLRVWLPGKCGSARVVSRTNGRPCCKTQVQRRITLNRAPLAAQSSASDEQKYPAAVFQAEVNFSAADYWNERYDTWPEVYEWYKGYEPLVPLLELSFPDKAERILHIGVGTSRIQEDMVNDGWQHITNVDYSPVAVEALQTVHAGMAALEYAVADCRSMPQYADSSFGGVLDKGTLDAMLCGDDDEGLAGALLREVHRVIAPGAAYLMVTSGSPRTRLKYLMHPALTWSVEVYEIGQQGKLGGPYDARDGAMMSSLPRMAYSHYGYICTKPPAASA